LSPKARYKYDMKVKINRLWVQECSITSETEEKKIEERERKNGSTVIVPRITAVRIENIWPQNNVRSAIANSRV
jgi:hypothetical protein